MKKVVMPDFENAEYKPFPSFDEWSNAEYLPEAFDTYAEDIRKLRDSTDKTTLETAIETARRWAAIETGAIEGLYEVDRGFTFTVAVEAATIESIHALKGEKTARTIEDALNGYDQVLDISTSRTDISEAWIRNLHSILCKSQETYTVLTAIGTQEQEFPKGVYKAYPNNPLNLGSNVLHAYAPVADTPSEMHRLMEELRSERFINAHPLLQASYAHYAFVCIHPFSDGNGRVSRALGSIYLYRNPGIPLVIFADQKNVYIDALEEADRGNYGRFIQFVTDVSTDTIQLIRAQMQRRPRAALNERIQGFENTSRGRGGLEHEEVDAIAIQLLQVFQKTCIAVIKNIELPQRITVQIRQEASRPSSAPNGYRVPPNASSVVITSNAAKPSEVGRSARYSVAVGRPEATGADYMIFDNKNQRIVSEVFLREVYPIVSGSLQYRFDVVAEDEIAELIDKLIETAEEDLRSKGYLS